MYPLEINEPGCCFLIRSLFCAGIHWDVVHRQLVNEAFRRNALSEEKAASDGFQVLTGLKPCPGEVEETIMAVHEERDCTSHPIPPLGYLRNIRGTFPAESAFLWDACPWRDTGGRSLHPRLSLPVQKLC